MDFEFEQDQPLDVLPLRAQPRYQKIVMRGAGRFYLEGTLPTGEPFSVRLGPSDASSDPPSR
jgi:hypothetical protein